MPLWADDLLALAVFLAAGSGMALAFYSTVRCGERGCWRPQSGGYDPETRRLTCRVHDRRAGR